MIAISIDWEKGKLFIIIYYNYLVLFSFFFNQIVINWVLVTKGLTAQSLRQTVNWFVEDGDPVQLSKRESLNS